ncbi:MAG: hypothetical protein LUC83_08310, partial [Clostridiales bacterium]|nr:hypothetical protein [Clostridiales bacterium]
ELYNATFSSAVRRLESTDWAHANVLNQTIRQCVLNEVALQKANYRIKNKTIKTTAWSNNTFRIYDGDITADSLVTVYFAEDSKETASNAGISGTTEGGAIVLTCQDTPEDDIVIDVIEVRNEVSDSAG